MKKLILVAVLMLPVVAMAQLKGVVISATTNQPIADVTITTSANKTAITNAKGEFDVPCTGSLVVKHIAYELQNVVVTDCKKPILIALQPLNTNLREVTISATSSVQKELLQQPASITTLVATELGRGYKLFLDDAINANVPGVFMSRRGISSGQQFNIRGYGNGIGPRGVNSNFDTQGTKVYLNGIPLTDAEGITVLDDIDFNSLSNVEITAGPSGTLNGFAIAGVVQLKTKTAMPGQTSLSQNVLVGDYGLRRFTTTLQTATAKSQVLANYGYQYSDGYMPHNASTKQFINVTGVFMPSDKERINTYFGFAESYDQRAGELTISQYENGDYSGNPNYIKNDAHSAVKRFRAGLNYTNLLADWVSTSTTVFGSGAAITSASAGGFNDNAPVNYGLRSTLDFNFTGNKNFRISGIAGIEAQGLNAHPMSCFMVVNQNDSDGYNVIGNLRSNQVSAISTYSYFTQLTVLFAHGLSVTGGLGVNSMHINLQNRIYTSPAATREYDVRYNNFLAPSIALNKVFNDKLSAYASFSTGQKPPVSSNIIIGATGALNTALTPELATQFEIGTKGQLLNNRLIYKLALFNTNFSDKMTSIAVPLDSITTGYTRIANSGGQINRGIEVSLRYNAYQSAKTLLQSITPWANATYSDFVYSNFIYERIPAGQTQVITEVYSGNAVAGVSPWVFNAGVDFTLKHGFYGHVTYQFRDEMPITSDNVFIAQSFSLLNAKVGYSAMVAKHLTLDAYFGANNIIGNPYYIQVFANQLPDAYIPGPAEINFFGGINLKYTL